MHSAIKNYFSITKKEWNGMLVLVALMILVLIAPDIYQLVAVQEKVDFSRIKEAQLILDKAVEAQPIYGNNNYYGTNKANASFSSKKLKPKYFSFNPNNLSNELWRKLGLSERQIIVIKNYEAKGGRFYRKEDLQKIYSVTPKDYARLEPFINIPEKKFSINYSNTSSSYKTKPMVMVEINQADSAQLTAIRGIGPAFANRILKYRNRLGGFYRKNQLLEVYGLDSAKYAEIERQVEVDAAKVGQININTCDFEELKRNPYLSFKQMNVIIQYRKQHGNFKSIDDLKNVVILNSDILRKIEPYLSFK